MRTATGRGGLRPRLSRVLPAAESEQRRRRSHRGQQPAVSRTPRAMAGAELSGAQIALTPSTAVLSRETAPLDDEVAGPRLERAPSRKLELELERRDTATVSFARSHSGEVVLRPPPESTGQLHVQKAKAHRGLVGSNRPLFVGSPVPGLGSCFLRI